MTKFKWDELYELIEESVCDYKELDRIHQLMAEIQIDHQDYRTQRGRNPNF